MAVLCILNPASAGGRTAAAEAEIRERLEAALGCVVRVVCTERPGHAAELAAELGGRHRLVVAAGGDGTVSEVVRGFLEGGHDALLGVLPSGSGSDYARNLGIADRSQALRALAGGGRELRVDVGSVRLTTPHGPLGRPFVLTTGTGFSPRVIARATRRLKRVCGAGSYTVAGILAALGYRPPAMRWEIDGEAGEGRAFNIVVANAAIESGGACMSPGARLDDGRLWLGASLTPSALAGLWRMRRIFDGSHARAPDFLYRSASRVRIDSDPPVGVQVDGEVPGTTPAEFGLLPRRLRVLVPDGSPLGRGVTG